jgi:ribonucleoside-diphosphate reductase beta chain
MPEKLHADAPSPDLEATHDPGLENTRNSATNLLTYSELYSLWERQQWSVQDLSFDQDRDDWANRLAEEDRVAQLYALRGFFAGEQEVARELAPMLWACPAEDMRVFLCTQIADEARHVAFFDRFCTETGVLEADSLDGRIDSAKEGLADAFFVLFDEMLGERVRRLAHSPDDAKTLVEAVTLYHMIIEGVLALTGQHHLVKFNSDQGTLPGFVAGMSNVARDEHRHVAFGARFLRDHVAEEPGYRAVIRKLVMEALPLTDLIRLPPWIKPNDHSAVLLGVTVGESRLFGIRALRRRLAAIDVK